MALEASSRLVSSCRVWIGAGCVLFALSGVASGQSTFQRGDVNEDAILNLSDAIFLIDRLFLSTEPLSCEDAADINDNGFVNLTDAIYAARFLYLGDAAPPPPLIECGEDPSEDLLGCESYVPCQVVDDPCLDPAGFEDLLAGLTIETDFSFCFPAGLLEVPLDPFEISVCPADAAGPCGDLGVDGCAVEISGIDPFLDVDGGRLGLAVLGRVDELPIDVTEGFLNTTTTCLNSLHASGDPEAPFRVDLTVPFELEEVEPGVFEIIGLGDAVVEAADIQLDSSGGLVCILFEAAQGALIDVLVAPLNAATEGLVDGLADALVGRRLCAEGN